MCAFKSIKSLAFLVVSGTYFSASLYRAASISFTSSIRYIYILWLRQSSLARRETSSLLKDTLFRKGSRRNLVSVSDVL